MTPCDDTHRWLARLADAEEAGPDSAAARAHTAACAPCRAALAEQRQVAGILRRRPQATPSAWFSTRVAARLDDDRGWLGIVDWRVWTLRLAPLALVLMLVVMFGASGGATDPAAFTLDSWTRSGPEQASASAAVWSGEASTDALLETMLIGSDRVQPE